MVLAKNEKIDRIMGVNVIPGGYIKVAKCKKTVQNGYPGVSSRVSAPLSFSR